MTVGELIALRHDCRFSQKDMATAMALSLRAYHEIEAQGEATDLGRRHAMLAERVSLDQAVHHGKIDIAAPSVRRAALELARLIHGL